ncbi:MAG: tRNA uridine-5-carboxymethylaminomethyl(34) synthesis GTPase MnmE [Tidjanibacter sp.]|nr:tRNA uridine-5-carboxymethylaminomethyl(34) synthesis GTPase MnmE [Tidjanibacter sp.]
MITDDTIVALSSGTGGAIAVIRMSGEQCAEICDRVVRSAKGRTVASSKGYTMLYGNVTEADGGVIDDAVVAIYKAPHSYTGEDMVEITVHASRYIIRRTIARLVEEGARAATAGEFTARAFLAGRMDLSQAEAVADIIASHDRATHHLASQQMRGGYSEELQKLRSRLLHLAAMLELELDFGEEDVEFADRTELVQLMEEIAAKIESLTASFALGRAIKEGVGVAIVGRPNAGKSTLLNTLLGDQRAIVSEVAGTTRDVIEEHLNIDGVDFRFIDTAGLHQSDDQLEQMGMERSRKAIEQAHIVVALIDGSTLPEENDNAPETIRELLAEIGCEEDERMIVVINKCDVAACDSQKVAAALPYPAVAISARNGEGVERLVEQIASTIDSKRIYTDAVTVSGARHYQALMRASEALSRARNGLTTASPEMTARDIREVLDCLGTITGEVTSDQILQEIFSKFCIGK